MMILSLTVCLLFDMLNNNMDIKYLGHSSFRITCSTASIVTDPFSQKMVGIKYPKVEADIVTVSHNHEDHNKSELVGGNPLILDIPGEYEKQNVRITGFDVYHDEKEGTVRGKNILFKFEMDELSVLHCGDLGHTLTNEMIEEIGEVDILLIPIGGFFTIGPSEAVMVVREIEPKIVIPMHYNHSGLNQEEFSHLTSLPEFVSAMGASDIEPLAKYSVKKSDLELMDGVKLVELVITG